MHARGSCEHGGPDLSCDFLPQKKGSFMQLLDVSVSGDCLPLTHSSATSGRELHHPEGDDTCAHGRQLDLLYLMQIWQMARAECLWQSFMAFTCSRHPPELTPLWDQVRPASYP